MDSDHLALALSKISQQLDQIEDREQERAAMSHRGANKTAAAMLKVEANVELTRQEVLGTRSDFRRMEGLLAEMEVRVGQKIFELEARMDERFASVERRVEMLEAAAHERPTLPSSESA